uniref:Uncharacterized protein n=1 Tax=Onchocerca volvulus TaxID=6282 RepID=A0A8R1TYX8_ONCVO
MERIQSWTNNIKSTKSSYGSEIKDYQSMIKMMGHRDDNDNERRRQIAKRVFQSREFSCPSPLYSFFSTTYFKNFKNQIRNIIPISRFLLQSSHEQDHQVPESTTPLTQQIFVESNCNIRKSRQQDVTIFKKKQVNDLKTPFQVIQHCPEDMKYEI